MIENSTNESQPQTGQKSKSETRDRVTNVFNRATEGIAWLQIVVSSVILAALLAGLMFFVFPSVIALILAIFIMSVGIIAGIKLANRKYRQGGTVDFISKNNGNG